MKQLPTQFQRICKDYKLLNLWTSRPHISEFIHGYKGLPIGRDGQGDQIYAVPVFLTGHEPQVIKDIVKKTWREIQKK